MWAHHIKYDIWWIHLPKIPYSAMAAYACNVDGCDLRPKPGRFSVGFNPPMDWSVLRCANTAASQSSMNGQTHSGVASGAVELIIVTQCVDSSLHLVVWPKASFNQYKLSRGAICCFSDGSVWVMCAFVWAFTSRRRHVSLYPPPPPSFIQMISKKWMALLMDFKCLPFNTMERSEFNIVILLLQQPNSHSRKYHSLSFTFTFKTLNICVFFVLIYLACLC